MNDQRIKRQVRQRTLQELEESDSFWKNNRYFQENSKESQESNQVIQLAQSKNDNIIENDDEMDYIPQDSQDNQNINHEDHDNDDDDDDEDDYVDSVNDNYDDDYDDDDYDDDDDNENVDQEESDQNQIKCDNFRQNTGCNQGIQNSLLRQNLSEYSYIRGIHHFQQINKVERLGQTSYIVWNNVQNVQNVKKNKVLNEKYIGVPYTGRPGGNSEQDLTKTEFHADLFKLEDVRYHIDIEINQIKYIRKLILNGRNFKINQFKALRNLDMEQDISNERLLEILESHLEQIKKQRIVMNKEEASLFRQSIDQIYFSRKQTYLQKLTPLSIQLELKKRIEYLEFFLINKQTYEQDQIQKILSNIFSAETALSRSCIMSEWSKEYDYTSGQIAPFLIMQFDSDMALTLDLIRQSISLEIPSSQTEFMRSIFDEIAFGFFENQPQNLNNEELNLIDIEEISDAIVAYIGNNKKSYEFIKNLNDLAGSLTITQKIRWKANQLNFFPYDTKQYLYGRPVLSYIFYAIHKIHQAANIIKFRALNDNMFIKNKEYKLIDIIVEIITRSLKNRNQQSQIQELLRLIFGDDNSIIIQGLSNLLYHIRRLIYNYTFERISITFLVNWVNKLEKSLLVEKHGFPKSLNGSTQEDILQGIASQLQHDRCGICRVQITDSLVFIHNFDIIQNKQSQSQSQSLINDNSNSHKEDQQQQQQQEQLKLNQKSLNIEKQQNDQDQLDI